MDVPTAPKAGYCTSFKGTDELTRHLHSSKFAGTQSSIAGLNVSSVLPASDEQVSKLRTLLVDKDSEIRSLKNKLKELESREDLSTKVKELEAENSKLKSDLTHKSKRFEKEKKKHTELQQANESLIVEITALKKDTKKDSIQG